MIVDCAVYEDGSRRPGELPVLNACAASRRENAFVWIGLHEPTEDEFDAVRREFDLHELAVEDAITAPQRPKLDVYGDSLFIVLKPARYVAAGGTVEFGEILIFVRDGRRSGYPLTLALIAVVCLGLYGYFRRIEWI